MEISREIIPSGCLARSVMVPMQAVALGGNVPCVPFLRMSPITTNEQREIAVLPLVVEVSNISILTGTYYTEGQRVNYINKPAAAVNVPSFIHLIPSVSVP
jgi:hypothetical protein